MKHFRLDLVSILALLFLFIAGCSGEVSIPPTPEGTVETVTQSLAKNEPRAVWDAMPETWQADVKQIIAAYADGIEAEVYDGGWALVGKLANVMANKKSLAMKMLSDPDVARGIPAQGVDVSAAYDAMVTLLKNLSSSDIATHKGLKNLDVGRFLGTTGSKVMASIDDLMVALPDAAQYRDGKADMGRVTVKVISSGEAAAELEITVGEQTKEIAMTKVQNRWVPAEMADEWDENIARIKEGLEKMPRPMPGEEKQHSLALIRSLEEALSSIDKAETKEQFMLAMAGAGANMQLQDLAKLSHMPGLLRPRPRARVVDVYFYDLGTDQLFAAPATELPPIDAPSGAGNGVRVYVYGCGDCSDANRFIAYLEKYTPHAKAAQEKLMNVGPDADPNLALGYDDLMMEGGLLVRAVKGGPWVPMYSDEGMKIASEVLDEDKCKGTRLVPCLPGRDFSTPNSKDKH